jgi:NADPH2:quinone reductase
VRTVVARELGPPELLAIEDWAPRRPAAGEVRVRIHAAGVGFVDALTVAGDYQIRPPLPYVPGSEFAGEVIETGEGVTRLSPGMAVCGGSFGGAFAEEITLPEDKVMPIGQHTSMIEAAVLRASYITAWIALAERTTIAPGETLLVLGAGGAMGLACCQLGRHFRATVIASASTAEKRALALENGADHAIDSGAADWRDRIKALTAGRGVDVVADMVGGELSQAALRSLAWNGRYLVIGFASGTIPSLPANLALLKGAAILGVDARQFGVHHPDAAQRGREQVGRLFDAGILRPPVARVFPLEEFAEAMRLAASGTPLGRVVLRMT